MTLSWDVSDTGDASAVPNAAAARPPDAARVFVHRFGATRRGARLARLLAAERLGAWGVARGSGLSDSAVLVVSELAANAVLHGHVPGRDAELRLVLCGGVLRVEVSDARGERLPQAAGPADGQEAGTRGTDARESGRGLRLVAALADAWGVVLRPHAGKTVWAELRAPEDG